VDKNFAIHLPLIDWLFGTLHLPGGGPMRTASQGIQYRRYSMQAFYPLSLRLGLGTSCHLITLMPWSRLISANSASNFAIWFL
jgi:hypothetical protein